MASWKEIYHQALNWSDEQRKEVATSATANIIRALRNNIPDDQISVLFLSGASTFICVDGVVNQDEYEFFTGFTGFEVDYDTFFELVKTGANPELVNIFKNLLQVDDDLKNNFLVLGLCLCACNGTITVEEQKYIESLL